MPVYQQIIVALPQYSKTALADLFKKYTSTILSSKGVIRGIENHGIRPLPEKAKRYLILLTSKPSIIF
jgi:ribosomal protein S6